MPKVEHWLVECDPLMCMPQGNLTQPNHVVDCLATGIWGSSYIRHYDTEPSYPTHCVKGWLECTEGNTELHHPKHMTRADHPTQVTSHPR
eukprot:CAMPEP_0115542692 /NCGR_PEP_ID=MMETSP0271-20121206/91139_1 /TAXON_ID=71861 /ORGANISM="Scrippsiella trochoidea, Strain CCMP3099" /LENGTH=89 /DNA_ID=CAMNT_0002975855 /DNA_START=6 /DNA_END=271 /DNA_ORIENTATION=-